MGAARGRKSGHPTIVTVAQEAGVHYSTASRALSDDVKVREGVALATRERVSAAADRLGYRRNRVGASLRTGRTGVIGVLVPRISDIVVALAYEALDEVARQQGYVTLVASTLDDPACRHDRILQLMDHGVDAILYSDAHLGDNGPADGSYGVPVLPFLRSSGEPSGPTADDAGGGRLAARHLVDLGHRCIAVVAGPSFASTARNRTQGFLEELRQAGTTVRDDHIVDSTFDVAGGKAAAATILERGQLPDAIFAVNDFTAIGVMAAARAHGLTVPDDISLVGFNDIPMAGELPVPLTTVRSPLREVGAAAAGLALRAIRGEALVPDILATTLMVRASTAMVRAPK